MKLTLRLIKLFLLMGLTLAIIIFIVFLVDSQRTNYLSLSNFSPKRGATYLIVNINIVPMDKDTIMEHKMVLIKEGVISQIADSINAKNLTVINGNNRYLVPGLIDMHVHLWDAYELGLYLSYGVTTLRNAWGMPMHTWLKRKLNEGTLIGPQLYTTGAKLTGPEYIGNDNLQLFTPEQAKQKVILHEKRGYDFIKTYRGLDKEVFDAILMQATELKLEIVAHPSEKVPFQYHFKSQISSIEHAEEIVQQPLGYTLDTLKLNEVVRSFSEASGTSFCPTLISYYNIYNMLVDDGILNAPTHRYINPLIRVTDSKKQFKRWTSTKNEDTITEKKIYGQHQFHLKMLKKLHDADVTIICGTDAGIGVTVPGLSLHQELALYVEAGFSNYEAIKTATVNPSKTHKVLQNIGTIEVGKTANFILVEDNPLGNLSTLEKPKAVFVKGTMLKRETLDKFQKKAKNRKNILATALRYAEYQLVE